MPDISADDIQTLIDAIAPAQPMTLGKTTNMSKSSSADSDSPAPQSIADQSTALYSRDPAVQKAAIEAMQARMTPNSLMGRIRSNYGPAPLMGVVPRSAGALMSPFMTGGSNQ